MKLNDLLTSEFTDGYTNEELVIILKEFRKKYRELHSEKLRIERESKGKELDRNKLLSEIKKREKTIDTLRNRLHKGRKLTLKERVFGKIDKA